MKKISPSILSADFTRLAHELKALEEAGADYVHVDVMDGNFVPNITVGPFIVEAARRATTLPLDVHLMIERPENFVADFAQAGSSIITVHVEATCHLHKAVQSIKEHGVRAGVSINPGTPVSALEDIIEDVDLVLVMSVNPGFSGQGFIPGSLKKISALREMIGQRGLPVEIEVDGGIKTSNIAAASVAGADVFVSGSGIFGAPASTPRGAPSTTLDTKGLHAVDAIQSRVVLGAPDYGKTIMAMKEAIKSRNTAL